MMGDIHTEQEQTGLGRRVAGALFRLFSHRWVRYLLVGLIGLAILETQLNRVGVSLFPKQAVILVKSPYYQAGMACWEELDYAGAEENLLRALEETRDRKGDGNLENAQIMQKLGALYLEMSRFEDSYEYLSSAYVSFQKKLGNRDGMTIIARCQLCLYDIAVGNVEHGLAELSDAYDETKSASYKMQIASMTAQVYTKLGRYDEAERFYKLLFQFYENYRADPLRYVLLWNDYGVMLANQGEDERALSAYAYAEAYWQERDSAPDHHLALIYENAAQSCAVLGQTEKAMMCIDKALEIRRSIDGENGLPVAKAYLMAANVYAIMQLPDEQLDALNTAHTIAVSAAGENSGVCANITLAIGSFYREQGEMELAIKNHLAALEIQKNILGESDYPMAVIYEALAHDYNLMGGFDRSLEAAQSAVDICENLFGKDNAYTAQAYLYITWTYLNREEYNQAIFYGELAKDICDRHLPQVDANLAWSSQTLAQVYSATGRFEEAVPLFEEAVSRYETCYHTNFSDELALTYDYFGDACIEAEDYENAIKCYNHELAIRQKLHENDFKRLGDVYNSLGLAAYFGELYGDALSYYDSAKENYQAAINAAKDEETAKPSYQGLSSVCNNTAAVYEVQEDYDTAVTYELQCYQILKSIGKDYTYNSKVAQRLERLYEKTAPAVSFEEWLEGGAS